MECRGHCNQNESCVRILGSKSNTFSVHAGLKQGSFVTDSVWDFHRDIPYIGPRIGEFPIWWPQNCISAFCRQYTFVVFTRHLHHELDQLAAECEVARMRIQHLQIWGHDSLLENTGPSISGCCSWVRVRWSMNQWTDQCGVCSDVALNWTVMMKRELSLKAKVSIYWFICVPTLSKMRYSLRGSTQGRYRIHWRDPIWP